jgi:hypothetical protein
MTIDLGIRVILRVLPQQFEAVVLGIYDVSVETGSGGRIYVPSSTAIGSGI